MKLPKSFVSDFRERLARFCFELKDQGVYEKLERFSFSYSVIQPSLLNDPKFLPLYQYTSDGLERFLIWAEVQEGAASVYWTLTSSDPQAGSTNVSLPMESKYAFAGYPFTDMDLRGMVLPDGADVTGMFCGGTVLRSLFMPELPAASSVVGAAVQLKNAETMFVNTSSLKELYGPGWLRYLNIQDIINTNTDLSIMDI